MTITYILGNGFDVQLGLRSRYSDFLDEYTVPAEKDSDNIKAFKEMLRNEPIRKLWSDAEKAMGQYLHQFSDSNISEYIEQITDFEEKMMEFLENQQNWRSFDQSEKIRNIFSDFILNSFGDVLNRRGHELDIDKAENNVVHILSFNYTNLIDKIVEVFPSKVLRNRAVQRVAYTDKLGKVIHVHGTLDSQIIMGVNDVDQLNVTGGVTIDERLQWNLVKPVQNSRSNSTWDVSGKSIIDDSHIIAIYGVSFGETDKMWWEYIKKWLKHSASHKLVIFKRADDGIPNTRLPGRVLEYEDNARRDVLKKLMVEEDDIQKLRDQVYIVLNTTRLNLKDALITGLPFLSEEQVSEKNVDTPFETLALVGG